jgi:hypothetical protein
MLCAVYVASISIFEQVFSADKFDLDVHVSRTSNRTQGF